MANNTVDKEKEFLKMICENERLIYKVCSFYNSEEFLIADLYQEVIVNLWSEFDKFRNESNYFLHGKNGKIDPLKTAESDHLKLSS
ncbi:hypothetical protein LJB92_00620 [Bacteroidales bacterium OttesenSCG-928-M06]|nr:hypothetical protein [Bacteroidales bacterium OttesenSCG-928-M06]